MFKVGDKVVCIDNLRNEQTLSVGKIYTIDGSSEKYGSVFVRIGFQTYYQHRFIHLKEYRKQKLNKICLEKVIE